MSHSSRVSLALAAVVVAAALSAGMASAQGNSSAVNSLPSPYQPVDGFFNLPEGRKIGSTAGIHVDRDGSSIWVFDRCGGQGCVGSNLAPIQKFDASGKLVKSFGAGMFIRPHGLYVDTDGPGSATEKVGQQDPNRMAKVIRCSFNPDGKL